MAYIVNEVEAYVYRLNKVKKILSFDNVFVLSTISKNKTINDKRHLYKRDKSILKELRYFFFIQFVRLPTIS